MSLNLFQRDYEEERKRLKLLPQASLPVIKLEKYGKILLAQINVKSWVVADLKTNKPYKKHTGFLFEIKPRKNQFPLIQTVGKIPVLFHPHFRYSWFWEKFTWIDYEEYDPEYDPEYQLGDYLLKIAHSLKYDEDYIGENVVKIGNPEALEWYLKHKNTNGYFPTDNTELPYTLEEIKENLSNTHSPNRFKTMNPTTSQRRKKFEVKNSEPPYQPEQMPLPDFSIRKGSVSSLSQRWGVSQKHCLYIQASAWKTIARHIQWGHHTQNNQVEQGGILLGQTYVDADKDQTYGVVEQAIDGKLAKGTSAYLEVTHETWKEMFDRVDKLRANSLQIIGWYHTHPRQLDVFMSGTDQATQSRLFGNDWQFAIVLNPQKKIWRAFCGSDSDECQGHVIEDEEKNTNKPQVMTDNCTKKF